MALFATVETAVFLSEPVSLFGRFGGRLQFIEFIRGISARGSLKAGYFGNLVTTGDVPLFS